MPTLNISNLSTSVLALPGGYYTDPVLPGATVAITVDDTDEFLGLESIQHLIAAGIIRIETSTDDPNLRPVLVYTTVTLPAASTMADGTMVWDSTRMKLIVSYGDVWQDETVVIAGTAAALDTLRLAGNVPTNAIAYNTDSNILMRYAGGAWATCSFSNPAAVGAALPVGPHYVGQLAYLTTTQALMVCTVAHAVLGTWATIFVAPTGAGAAPAHAAAVAGGAYFDTNNSRLSFHNGAAWVHLPVATYANTAGVEALRVGATAGQMGWNTDTNRWSVYTGAAWFNETTVGMYAPGGTHLFNGAIVFDKTGFSGTMATSGMLRVYDTTAVAGWRVSEVVLTGYAGAPALPVVEEVPNGTLVLETTGGAGARLYAKIGGAWVTDL